MGHNAYVDITHHNLSWLMGQFLGVHTHLMSCALPLDFTRDMIPVMPTAHYTCGGMTANLKGSVVSIDCCGIKGRGMRRYCNLYAAKEAARVGLHGDNQLASASLLKGLVFG
jgi:L-aspartate oxidase